MKLEMTLPERPGFLHAVPILTIFALLQLFFLLGPSLKLQSGVTVDLPLSRFQLDRYQNSVVVTLGPGENESRIHLGRDSVTLADLDNRLEQLKASNTSTPTLILLQTDAGTPVGAEREVTELIISKGFRMAIVGTRSPPPSVPTLPKMTP